MTSKMTSKMAVLAVLAVATAGMARAQAIDPIETRQAGQDLLSGTFAGIRAVVAAKGDVKTLEVPAKAMARWITQFPTQFPKGSEQGHNTKALPAVWSDNAGLPEGRDQPRQRVDQARGTRQGRRHRRGGGAGQGGGGCVRGVSQGLPRPLSSGPPRGLTLGITATQGQGTVIILPAPACLAWRRCTARARTPACPTPASRCSHRPAAPAVAHRRAGRSGFPAHAGAAARSRSR